MLLSLETIRILSPEQRVISFSMACLLMCWSREQGLNSVLAQGVFDILHAGHVEYLLGAKDGFDLLFVGVENDRATRKNKGDKRPFTPLAQRLVVLSTLRPVDYVFVYPDIPDYQNSDSFSGRFHHLQPTALAISDFDPNIANKISMIEKFGIIPKIVSRERIQSSTQLLKLLGFE